MNRTILLRYPLRYGKSSGFCCLYIYFVDQRQFIHRIHQVPIHVHTHRIYESLHNSLHRAASPPRFDASIVEGTGRKLSCSYTDHHDWWLCFRGRDPSCQEDLSANRNLATSYTIPFRDIQRCLIWPSVLITVLLNGCRSGEFKECLLCQRWSECVLLCRYIASSEDFPLLWKKPTPNLPSNLLFLLPPKPHRSTVVHRCSKPNRHFPSILDTKRPCPLYPQSSTNTSPSINETTTIHLAFQCSLSYSSLSPLPWSSLEEVVCTSDRGVAGRLLPTGISETNVDGSCGCEVEGGC